MVLLYHIGTIAFTHYRTRSSVQSDICMMFGVSSSSVWFTSISKSLRCTHQFYLYRLAFCSVYFPSIHSKVPRTKQVINAWRYI